MILQDSEAVTIGCLWPTPDSVGTVLHPGSCAPGATVRRMADRRAGQRPAAGRSGRTFRAERAWRRKVPPASVISRRVLLFWRLKVWPQCEQCRRSATQSTRGGVPPTRVARAILAPDQPALRAGSRSGVSAHQSPFACRCREARSGRRRPAPGPGGWVESGAAGGGPPLRGAHRDGGPAPAGRR